MNKILFEVNEMREEYDFSKARKNPYAKQLKKQITINLDVETIDYFKAQSSASRIPLSDAYKSVSFRLRCEQQTAQSQLAVTIAC